jgi:hypothetical protein
MTVATKVARFAQKPLPDKWKAITATIGAAASDFLPPVLARGLAKVIRRSSPTGLRVAPYQRDEFLTWLTYINPGMLVPGNLALLNHSIQRMPETGVVIEIGSFAGLSLNHIIHMMTQTGRSNVVFSVDEWNFENINNSLIPGSSVNFSDYRELAIDTFRRNVLLFHSNQLPHHIGVSSDKFFQLWSQKNGGNRLLWESNYSWWPDLIGLH